ncbi:MAG: hypothetical protein QF824_00980 [Candidatus Woesearchaeota archaeon]|jgi:hypothetical protein|nr:hypothetical protein [Candidatus Woesearchaeota archaeon]
MKKDHKVILLIVLIVIITSVYFTLTYRRVDIIGRQDNPVKNFFFKLFNKDFAEKEQLPEGVKPSPPRLIDKLQKKEFFAIDYNNLYLKEQPNPISLNCLQQNNFIITLGNSGENIISDIKFSVEENSPLIFEFPENIVIPPNSVKETTIFVVADCSKPITKQLTPKITIANKIEFIIPITIDERLE